MKAAFASAAKTYKAEFRSDYGYHAQMEPLNAVVRINDAGDKAEVWEGSQAPDESRKAVAEALGLKPEQVTFNQCYMGGGFGRRSLGDYAAECARHRQGGAPPGQADLDARGGHRPGHVPPAVVPVPGGGDRCLRQGHRLEALRRRRRRVPAASPASRSPITACPTSTSSGAACRTAIKLKHWRAVGHVFNVFAIESMVDQMAVDAGMDPIDFRFQRMGIDRRRRARCFETVAQMCDWKRQAPGRPRARHLDHRALGLARRRRGRDLARPGERQDPRAQGVDRDRRRRHRAARSRRKNNVESAIIYGLSSVLHERVTIKDGAVEQSNFHDYNLMRMSDLPEEMHVSFVDVDTRPTGLGEIGNPFIAGADLQCVLPADRQAAAPPAVHARARAGDAQGLSAVMT